MSYSLNMWLLPQFISTLDIVVSHTSSLLSLSNIITHMSLIMPPCLHYFDFANDKSWYEEFEDIKRVIRIRKSKKDRARKGLTKKDRAHKGLTKKGQSTQGLNEKRTEHTRA